MAGGSGRWRTRPLEPPTALNDRPSLRCRELEREGSGGLRAAITLAPSAWPRQPGPVTLAPSPWPVTRPCLRRSVDRSVNPLFRPWRRREDPVDGVDPYLPGCLDREPVALTHALPGFEIRQGLQGDQYFPALALGPGGKLRLVHEFQPRQHRIARALDPPQQLSRVVLIAKHGTPQRQPLIAGRGARLDLGPDPAQPVAVDVPGPGLRAGEAPRMVRSRKAERPQVRKVLVHGALRAAGPFGNPGGCRSVRMLRQEFQIGLDQPLPGACASLTATVRLWQLSIRHWELPMMAGPPEPGAVRRLPSAVTAPAGGATGSPPCRFLGASLGLTRQLGGVRRVPPRSASSQPLYRMERIWTAWLCYFHAKRRHRARMTPECRNAWRPTVSLGRDPPRDLCVRRRPAGRTGPRQAAAAGRGPDRNRDRPLPGQAAGHRRVPGVGAQGRAVGADAIHQAQSVLHQRVLLATVVIEEAPASPSRPGSR